MIDPDLDARLTAIEESVQDTHKIITRMRRVQRSANVMRFFYWIVIIIVTIGAYYYIQPWLVKLEAMYNSASATVNELKIPTSTTAK